MDNQAIKGRWAVSSMFCANGFMMGVWATQIPLLLTRHHITETTLGLLILGLGMGAVGAMLFSGRLIHTYGSQRMLRIFALLATPTLLLVVLAPNLYVLAPTMALLGAVIGCMDVAMNANAVEVERRLGRAIMSASHGFWSLGGFIGGSVGAFVLAHVGAQVQVMGATVVTGGLVLASLPYLIADAPAPPEVPGETTTVGTLFPRDASLWLLGFMALFSMVPEGAVMDWAAIYLNKELAADTFRSGLGYGLFAGTMAVVRFAGDGIRNRFGAVRTLRYSALIGAVGLMGGALAPSALVAIVSFGIAGLGVANMVPILFSAAGNHPGIASGVAISTVTMVGYAGILIAPSTIGFVAEHIGFRTTYAALSLLLIVVALLAGRTAAADGVRGT